MAQIKDFVVRSGVIVQGTTDVTTATGSTQTLQVNGGASIAKSLQVGGAATIYGNETVYGSLAVTGNGRVSAFTASGIVTVTDSTAATTAPSGALVVSGGAYLGNNLIVNGSGASTATLANNALYVVGGVGIGNSLVVTGQALFKDTVTFSGTATYVYSTNTIFTDNIQNLHTPPGGIDGAWTTDDGKDIGFVFHNYINSADNDAFLGWNNNSGYLEWYSVGIEGGSGVFTGTEYGIFKTGGIVLTSSTQATSTTSGALQVAGGVGIGGNIYVGGSASVNTLTSRSLTSGKVVIVGTGGLLTEDDGLSYNTATNILTTTVTNAITATNLAAGAIGDVPYQSAVGITSFIPVATNGYVLSLVGGLPAWKDPATLPSSPLATTATNIADGFASAIAFQTSPGNTSVSNQNLRFDNGTNTFRTVNAVFSGTTAVSSTVTGAVQVVGGVGIGGGLFVGGTVTATSFVGVITTATNIAGGVLGQIPYQTAAGTTQFIGTGTLGTILQMGANTATFASTSGIYVGFANQSVFANTATNIAGGTAGSVNYQVSPGVTSFIGLGDTGSILQVGVTTATFVSSSSIYVGYSNASNNIIGGELGQLPYQTGAGSTQFIGTGTAGTILQMGSANTATFANTSNIYVGFANQAVYANTATNVAGGTNGALVYQASVGVTSFIGTGTTNSLLQMGTTTATFVSSSSVYVGYANSSSNILGGSVGQIPYQTGSGATQFIGTGTAGTILQMGAANTATFVSTSNVYVGYANTAAFALVVAGVVNTASNITINNEQAATTQHYVVSVSTSSGNLPLRVTAAWGPYYIPSTGQFVINTNTNASSVSTGALVVGGGAGLGGKLYVGDNSNATLVNNGALVVSGGVGVGNAVFAGGKITAGASGTTGASVDGFSSNNFLISSFTSNTINTVGSKNLDAFSTSTYRTARYTVQIVDGTSVHVSELLAFHANGNVYLNEYGIVTNAGTLGTFDAAIVGTDLTLQFTPTAPSSMTIKVVRTGITS